MNFAKTIISLIFVILFASCAEKKDDKNTMLAAGLLLLSSGSGSVSPASIAVTDKPPVEVLSGGLAWNYYYMKISGGTTGTSPSTNADFSRCKACHGWDNMGIKGGYVRRTSTATRPGLIDGVSTNTVAGGGDLTGKVATIATVGHTSGRAFSTENGTMPNYTADKGLTATQINNLVAYLNYKFSTIGSVATLDTTKTPVAYTFKDASVSKGKTLYSSNCSGCHGNNGKSSTTHIATYFNGDGKYSEGFAKILYGYGTDSGTGSNMTRESMGNLTPADVRDILSYIQAQIAAGGGDFGDLL